MARKRNLTLIIPLIRFVMKNPLAVILIIALGAVWYGFERVQRENYSYAGVPRFNSFSIENFDRVLRSPGFMVGYSEIRKNPLWAVYQLDADASKKSGKRPSGFKIDSRSLARVSHDDYTGSGYDRGHMAPNHAIAINHGRSAQVATFAMTNITPQKGKLNQKLWQRLEAGASSHLVKQFGKLWVYTGPIFDQDREFLKSGVEIPDAFYKIYVAENNGEPLALAFVMPQKVKGNEPLHKFTATVDEVEQLTGIDFFHKLDDPIEDAFEAASYDKRWKLDQITNIPSRY
jgi:endonuclease G